jgi:hypothetical protein
MIKASRILEEYITLYSRSRGDSTHTTPLFVNPDSNELRELGNDIRFIADSRREKVYVWNAYKELHCFMAEFLYGDDETPPHMFWGTAEREGGKYIIKDSHVVASHIANIGPYNLDKSRETWIQNFFFEDWQWLKRYFKIDDYFKIIKDKVRDKGIEI